MLDYRAKLRDKQRQAMDLSGQLMAINRLILMKERQRELEATGVWKDLVGMDVTELSRIMLDSNIRDEKQRELMRVINETIGTDDATLAAQEDPQMREVLKHMESARESGRVDHEFSLMTNDDSESVFDR